MGSWGFPEGGEEKWEVELLGWVGGLGPLDWVAGCQEGLNRVGESWPGPLSSRPSLERYRGAAQGAGPAGGGCRGCRERIGHFPRIDLPHGQS